MKTTRRTLSLSLAGALALAACGAPPEAPPGARRPATPVRLALPAAPAAPLVDCTEAPAASTRRRAAAEPASRRSRGASTRAAPSDRGACAQ